MAMGINQFDREFAIRFGDEFLSVLRGIRHQTALLALMSDVSRYLGFRYFALITHEDLRLPVPGQVDIRDYPAAIAERIIGQGHFRRDPVMRGCIFADSAFLWSQLPDIIDFDRRDRITLEFGAGHGLCEGITVPCHRHGYRLGSCTFAGALASDRAERLLGIVDMIGTFAFKQARLISGLPMPLGPRPRLHPRPRDCVILAAQGLTNKAIARALGLSPRTVDRYLKDARRLYGATKTTELLAAAVFAGEIDLSELR